MIKLKATKQTGAYFSFSRFDPSKYVGGYVWLFVGCFSLGV